jgi:hypothetical protein
MSLSLSLILRPTVSRPVCLGIKAPIWGLRPDFCYCQTVAGLLMWGSLSDKRTRLSLRLPLLLASAVIFRSESLGTRDHILRAQIRDFRFHRLLGFAGLRWRYSTPSPHGNDLNSRINSLFVTSRESYMDHYVEQLILLCSSPVATGMSLLISVA